MGFLICACHPSILYFKLLFHYQLECYSCFPRVLQYRMNLAFEYGVRMVNIPNTEVVPIALSEALDGKDTNDYLQRVEPSIQGGRKIASLVLSKLGLRRSNSVRKNANVIN